MRRQTAINKYSEFISVNENVKLKDAPFLVKWRLRFSNLGWLSILTWQYKISKWRTDRTFKKLSPEKKKEVLKAFQEIINNLE